MAQLTGVAVKPENLKNVERIAAQDGVKDAEEIAAALLLRRVETMLRNGQPRQAVAHIVELTGVDGEQAGAFVEELKQTIFG